MGEMFEELGKGLVKSMGLYMVLGVGGAEFIKEKNKEGFTNHCPKVYGTWIIDRLTEKII